MCARAFMHACVCVYMLVSCIRACVGAVYMRTFMHSCMYEHAYIFVRVCACVCLCFVCACVCNILYFRQILMITRNTFIH